jgi:hypothetical protein
MPSPKVRRYHASRGHHTLHSYVVRKEDYEGVVVHASFAEGACGVADAFVCPSPLRLNSSWQEQTLHR